jgi:hypothetical protein
MASAVTSKTEARRWQPIVRLSLIFERLDRVGRRARRLDRQPIGDQVVPSNASSK